MLKQIKFSKYATDAFTFVCAVVILAYYLCHGAVAQLDSA